MKEENKSITWRINNLGYRANKGWNHSIEEKQKISTGVKKAMLAGKMANRGILISKAKKGISLSEIHKQKLSFAHIGKKFSNEHKRKISLANKGRKLTKDHIEKSLQHRSMSSSELRVQEIINKYHLPYKFVGNGIFFIERKNPDFINVNGEKKAIEVYWNRHKEQFRGGVKKWKEERNNIFRKYGWKIIYIEQKEIKEKIILKKLL